MNRFGRSRLSQSAIPATKHGTLAAVGCGSTGGPLILIKLELTRGIEVDTLSQVRWIRTASSPNNFETGTTLLNEGESAVRGLFAFAQAVLFVTTEFNWSYDVTLAAQLSAAWQQAAEGIFHRAACGVLQGKLGAAVLNLSGCRRLGLEGVPARRIGWPRSGQVRLVDRRKL